VSDIPPISLLLVQAWRQLLRVAYLKGFRSRLEAGDSLDAGFCPKSLGEISAPIGRPSPRKIGPTLRG
jgi:hypothetical protein